jgi:8-oxo-dGTP pyrophosphatase MutT (NUDIX family)
MTCNNCFKEGHFYRNCDKPLLSYGLCCYKKIEGEEVRILMVKRRNTYTYIEFLRGIYDILDEDYLQIMFTKMSKEEKENILISDFKTLWNNLWLVENNLRNKNEFYKGIIKFNILKNGFFNNKKVISLNYLIKYSSENYDTPEWYFPKGKKETLSDNTIETDIQTSIREFCEETNINQKLIKIHTDKILEELHLGSNNKYYKSFFYISEYLNDDIDEVIIKFKNYKTIFQKNEIGDIKWIKISELKNYFRKYEHSKFNLIKDLEAILKLSD